VFPVRYELNLYMLCRRKYLCGLALRVPGKLKKFIYLIGSRTRRFINEVRITGCRLESAGSQ
jgi:hypothetical protein